MSRNASISRISIVAMCLAALVIAGAAQADYVAYSVDKKGVEKPLPEDVKAIVAKNAKHLVAVRWGEYAGRKIRLGVLEADNQSSASTYHFPMGGSYSTDYQQVPVNGIDALLTDALTQTKRFRVLTRTELGDVLDEQDLGDSGRVAKPSAAKIGNVLGAQYLIQVVVNSYEANTSGKKGGLGGFGRKLGALGGIAGGKSKSSVQMTFKLIDAETSEVVASEVVDSKIVELSLGVAAGAWGGAGAIGGFFSGYSKTPIGQAVMATVNVGVFELIKQLGNLPISGSVVKVEEARAIVNLGEDTVSVGDQLSAVSKGEEFIDPDTGLSLGAEEEEIGILEVIEVKDKYSYVKPVGFEASRLSRGNKVVSTKPAAPLEYATDWKK